MSNVLTKDALAKIAIAKNLIKEYKNSNSERTVYLNDGTEFQIYLKNPYQTHLGIKIYVNNKSIGGNMLVLRPGQSVWLDRFIDENSKFLFSTYKVEDTGEMRYAINSNGKVKIEFYHEKEDVQPLQITWRNNNNWFDNTVTCYYNSTVSTCDCCNSTLTTSSIGDPVYTSASTTYSTATGVKRAEIDKSAEKSVDKNLSLETGRVEKGGRSDQEFEYCNINFDYYPFKTENIHILPNSQKQTRVEDTRRKYCSQCGKKVSPKDKFCSNCGARLS